MNVTQTTMPRRESNTDYDQQPEAFTSVQLRNRTVMLSQKQSHRNSQSFDSEDVDNESQPLQVIVSMGNHFTPPKLDQSPVVPSDAHNPDPVNVELQTSTQTATKVQAQTSDEISPNVIPAPTLDKQEGLLNDDKPAEA